MTARKGAGPRSPAGSGEPTSRASSPLARSLPWLGGALLALVMYNPVLAGRVPFPSHILLGFPPWRATYGAVPPSPRHAELGDLVTLVYPWRVFTHNAVRSGELPLWNPHTLLGAPFEGNCTSAVFYPPNFLFDVLPVPTAWALSFPLRTMLAFAFAALLARLLGASPAGQTIAGLGFSLCGFMTSWQGWPQVDTLLWLPLGLLAVEALRRAPGPRNAALAAAALAVPVFAGHPEIAFYVAGATGLYWLFRVAFPAARTTRRATWLFVLFFVAAGVLAIAVAAIQILPTLEWVGQLSRRTDAPLGWHIPVRHSFAIVSRDAGASPNSAGLLVPEEMTYAGMLTLVLAPLAFFDRRRREALFFLVLGACAFGVAYGLQPVFGLSQIVPVIRGFPNGRLVSILDFCLVMMAALGLTAAEERVGEGPRVRRGMTLAVLGASAVAGAALVVLFKASSPRPAGPAFLGPGSSVVVLALAALLVLSYLQGWLRRRAFPVAVVALLAADLGSFAYNHVPTSRASAIFPEPGVYRRLRALDASTWRIASVDMTAPANQEIVYGLSSPTGYDYVTARIAYLLSPLTGSPAETFLQSCLRAARIIALPDRRLDLMNLKYLMATAANESAGVLARHPERFREVLRDGSVRVFENLRVLPRAFLVPAAGVEVVATPQAALERLASPAFDPAASVLLETRPTWPPVDPSVPTKSAVRSIEIGLNDNRFVVDVSQPGVLVIGEMEFPGWRAFVDDRPAQILRADYTFRAVALSPGHHVVRLKYAPRPFALGLRASIAGLIGVGALALWPRSRRARPDAGKGRRSKGTDQGTPRAKSS